MNLEELNQVLITAAQNDAWIYEETDSSVYGKTIRMTNGWCDKFWLCVWDIFTCGSCGKKTQQVVLEIFENAQRLYDLQDKRQTFALLENIQTWSACRNNLMKVSCVWGRRFQALPTGTPLTSILNANTFNKQLASLLATTAILNPHHPRCENLENLTTAATEAHAAYQNEPTTQTWQAAATALRELKKCVVNWPADVADTDYVGSDRLDYMSSSYQIGLWNISKATHSLVTAGEYRKTISYLQITAALSRAKESEVQQFADEQIALLRLFLAHIPPSQRIPVSIDIHAGWKFQDQQEAITFSQAAMQLITDNPELFIHQATLYEEAKGDKNRGVCLSRVTGKGAQIAQNSDRTTFTPERPLSLATKAVIARLFEVASQDHKDSLDEEQPQQVKLQADWNSAIAKYLSEKPQTVGITATKKIQRELFDLEEGTNCTIRLFGKERGCHREILEEAFPFLEAQQRFEQQESNLIELDQMVSQAGISPDFGAWILDALCRYAYLREHPNLPDNSSQEALKAYRCYLTCIDILNPGSVALETI